MRILAATDGSESAGRAVRMAAALAKALGAELVLATVGPDRLSQQEMAEAALEGISPGDLLEAFVQRTLVEAKTLARSQGAPQIRVLRAAGDPAEMVLDAARSEQADMIVVGRRGRGRLAGLLLGSVSQKVVSFAPCAVVVVP